MDLSVLVSNNRDLHLLREFADRVWKSNEKQKSYQRPVGEPDLRVNDTSDKINPAKTNTKQAITVLINSVSFFEVLFFVVTVKLI